MLAFSVLGLCVAIAQVVRGDALFMNERASLDTEYRGKGGEDGPKYFHESSFHYHYDGRFGKKEIEASQKIPHLVAMIQTYLSTMEDIGAETWIMHGTLMGWYWNQKIMPWDSDLDVQVSETTMHFLANHYNMTEHSFKLEGVEKERKFLLEINPQFVVRHGDPANVIDARWIDTSSGLFIDITCVRKDYEERDKGNKGALMSKDRHKYNERDMFPLRHSVFEGAPAKVPFNYIKLLKAEYGEDSVTKTVFHDHKFDPETKVWVPLPPPPPKEEPPKKDSPKEEPPKKDPPKQEPPKTEEKPKQEPPKVEEKPPKQEPPKEEQPPKQEEQKQN